jgi:hypothetical protein
MLRIPCSAARRRLSCLRCSFHTQQQTQESTDLPRKTGTDPRSLSLRITQSDRPCKSCSVANRRQSSQLCSLYTPQRLQVRTDLPRKTRTDLRDSLGQQSQPDKRRKVSIHPRRRRMCLLHTECTAMFHPPSTHRQHTMCSLSTRRSRHLRSPQNTSEGRHWCQHTASSGHGRHRTGRGHCKECRPLIQQLHRSQRRSWPRPSAPVLQHFIVRNAQRSGRNGRKVELKSSTR